MCPFGRNLKKKEGFSINSVSKSECAPALLILGLGHSVHSLHFSGRFCSTNCRCLSLLLESGGDLERVGCVCLVLFGVNYLKDLEESLGHGKAG